MRGKKKGGSKFGSLTFTGTSRRKADTNQPTTLPETLQKGNVPMDDSEEVQILSNERNARLERRQQHNLKNVSKEREDQESQMQKREESELKRALELSRMEASLIQIVNKNEQAACSEHYAQSTGDQAEEEDECKMIEDDLLSKEQDSPSEDGRMSVNSVILMNSDNEKDNEKDKESDHNVNVSTVSDESAVSCTFPASDLLKGSSLRPLLEDFNTLRAEDGSKDDDAGSWQEKSSIGDCNLSQDLFAQYDNINKSDCCLDSKINDPSVGDKDVGGKDVGGKDVGGKDECSDEEYVPDNVENTEEPEYRMRSRLCSRKRKRADEEDVAATIKTAKTTGADDGSDIYDAETQIINVDEECESDPKDEIEKLVNGPFSLNPEHLEEERLTDSRKEVGRKQTKPSHPFYSPHYDSARDYSVVILQMFECYLKKIRLRRYNSSDQRLWSNPVRPGPHLPKYLIHRKRGVRLPPSEDDSDIEEEEDAVLCGTSSKLSGADKVGRKKNNSKIEDAIAGDCDNSDDDFQPDKSSRKREGKGDIFCRNYKILRKGTSEKKLPHSHDIVHPQSTKKSFDNHFYRELAEDSDKEELEDEQQLPTDDRDKPSSITAAEEAFGFDNDDDDDDNNSPSITTSSGLRLRHPDLHTSDSCDPPTSSQGQIHSLMLRRPSSNPDLIKPNNDNRSPPHAEVNPPSDVEVGLSPFMNKAQKMRAEIEDSIASSAKRVARIQPQNTSLWMSKDTFKARDRLQSEEVDVDGFIEDTMYAHQNREVNLPAPSTSRYITNDPRSTSSIPPSPPGPPPPTINNSLISGVQCPLCGSYFAVSVIEVHASECNGPVDDLQDEIQINDPDNREPRRSPVIDTNVPPKHKRIAPDDGSTGLSTPPESHLNKSMDHVDAVILQLVENNEIKLIPSNKPRSKYSRPLRDHGVSTEEVAGVGETRASLRRSLRKAEEEPRELCFICKRMVDRATYGDHVKQHEVEKRCRSARHDETDVPEDDPNDGVGNSRCAGTGDCSNLGQSSQDLGEEEALPDNDDPRLLCVYMSSAKEDDEDEGDICDWTAPSGMYQEDDSPIKAYKSINKSSSIVDFKNQFKASTNKAGGARGSSRARGKSRGSRKGRTTNRRGQRKALAPKSSNY